MSAATEAIIFLLKLEFGLYNLLPVGVSVTCTVF